MKATIPAAILTTLAILVFYQNCGNFRGITAISSTAPSIAGSSDQSHPSATPSAIPAPSPAQCQPPRHYQYVIQPGEEKFLACAGEDQTSIYEVTIPDSGRAIAIANLAFRNNDSNASYYWSAQILVGANAVAYANGDDICPQTTTGSKLTLGSGTLSPATSQSVRILGHQGSNPCADGRVAVTSGGTLDVYVEDPAPACQEQDLGLVSTYDVNGLTQTTNWTTSFAPALSLTIPESGARSHILLLASVEGTPLANPNTACGSESASLAARLVGDGVELASTIGAIPASQGMGHLVLGLNPKIPYTGALSTLQLQIGSNTSLTSVTTGGCCGDGKLGFIKLP